MRNTSIKEINMAKLRTLRAEFKELAETNRRKAEIIRRAEEAEAAFDIAMRGVKPLRVKHLRR